VATVLADGLAALRSAALVVAALALLVVGLRRLRPRIRAAVTLPGWLTPRTALPLGVLATGADLPNAFPYFIAIERLVDAEIAVPIALVALAAYTVVYCAPCLILWTIGVRKGPQVRARLDRLYQRWGSERAIPANRLAATGWVAGAAALLAVAVT
jgi:hypothetical protein